MLVMRHPAVALIVVITLAAAAQSLHAVEETDSTATPHARFWHSGGIAVAYYDHRFTDAVISPVVYSGSAPFIEMYYRGISDVHLIYIVLGLGKYTVNLRDGSTGGQFTVLDRNGDPYTYLGSLHELSGKRLVLAAEYLYRVRAFRSGRSGLHLGGRFDLDTEQYDGTNHWDSGTAWEADWSWRTDASIGVSGLVDRRFRQHDRLAMGSNLTLLSYVYRPQYFHPFEASSRNSKWAPPWEFLRWTATVSCDLWTTEKFAVTTYYQFQYQRVTEPRDLRSVTNIFSFGVAYGSN